MLVAWLAATISGGPDLSGVLGGRERWDDSGCRWLSPYRRRYASAGSRSASTGRCSSPNRDRELCWRRDGHPHPVGAGRIGRRVPRRVASCLHSGGRRTSPRPQNATTRGIETCAITTLTTLALAPDQGSFVRRWHGRTLFAPRRAGGGSRQTLACGQRERSCRIPWLRRAG